MSNSLSVDALYASSLRKTMGNSRLRVEPLPSRPSPPSLVSNTAASPTTPRGDLSTLPERLSVARVKKKTKSSRGDSASNLRSFPSGVALMDAPNIRCVLHSELGRAPYGADDLDLKRLRFWHKNVLMIRKCHFVVRPDPVRSRTGLREAVRRGNWRWVRCERARYGFNDDPVDDYIIHRLVELTDQFNIHQQNTISLISHDGGYAEYVERFVEAGGYVAILGILHRLSKRLWELANHDRVVLFDLDLDVHAVNHIERSLLERTRYLEGFATSCAAG